MDMERLLTGLFDYQRFERDPALQNLIDDTEARYFGAEISDDALDLVSAAGEPFIPLPDPNKWDKPL